MNPTVSLRHPLQRRLAAGAAALALAAAALPAQAQFGLFQNIIQQQMQQNLQQQAQQAQQAQQQAAAAKPVKKWAATKPVPAEVQAAASAFAAKTSTPELRPLFERLYIEGERNATLNFQRIGLAALSLGKLDIAERAFDAAAFRIDQIYADNAEAQKAKSLWTAEKIKDYKGEPYERAMAFFYRGLVYAAQNDFQNARAMFKQADYQDTVAEAEQYAGDFGLMPFMAGWASYCDGNASLARDYLQMARKGDKNYAGVSVEQPVLVLFESGRAPFKYGGGKFGEALKWQPHELPQQTARAVCTAPGGDCGGTAFVVGADVGFQATTRGGRPIDSVLGGKASFKEGAQNVADVAGTVGNVGMQVAMQTGSRDAAGLGMLGMVAGLVAQGVSASTQAQADIREWEQLPGTVWLSTGASRHNADSLHVRLESGGRVVGIGAQVAQEDGYVKLVSVSDNSPAARAGLRNGDLITHVSDAPIQGMPLVDAVARLRGQPGTPVTVAVHRKSDNRSFTATLVREEILNPVTYAPARRIVNTPSCQLYWGRAIAPLEMLRDAGPLEPGEHARDPALRQELEAAYAG